MLWKAHIHDEVSYHTGQMDYNNSAVLAEAEWFASVEGGQKIHNAKAAVSQHVKATTKHDSTVVSTTTECN